MRDNFTQKLAKIKEDIKKKLEDEDFQHQQFARRNELPSCIDKQTVEEFTTEERDAVVVHLLSCIANNRGYEARFYNGYDKSIEEQVYVDKLNSTSDHHLASISEEEYGSIFDAFSPMILTCLHPLLSSCEPDSLVHLLKILEWVPSKLDHMFLIILTQFESDKYYADIEHSPCKNFLLNKQLSLLSAKLIEREDSRFLVDGVIYRRRPDVFSRTPMFWFSSQKEAQEQCLKILSRCSISEKLKGRKYYKEDVPHYLNAQSMFKNKLAKILINNDQKLLLDSIKIASIYDPRCLASIIMFEKQHHQRLKEKGIWSDWKKYSRIFLMRSLRATNNKQKALDPKLWSYDFTLLELTSTLYDHLTPKESKDLNYVMMTPFKCDSLSNTFL